MALTWQVLHDQRLMLVRAEGALHLAELEKFFDDMVVEKSFGYAKLFDARGVEFVATDHDVMQIGARMRAYSGVDLRGGPVALVVDTPEAIDYIKRYLNLSSADRPAKLFSAEPDARNWLDEQRSAHKA